MSTPRIVRAGVSCVIFPLFGGAIDSRFVALVRRGRPPNAGSFSLPGGKVEWGESLVDAAMREAAEELNLRVDVRVAGDGVPAFAATESLHVDEGFHYVISHVLATARAERDGTSLRLPALTAGDDAVGATWVRLCDGMSGAPSELPTLASLGASLQVKSVVALAQRRALLL
jgi:ADP-ribose pyrophosphatase YjhB (NUDIX family)